MSNRAISFKSLIHKPLYLVGGNWTTPGCHVSIHRFLEFQLLPMQFFLKKIKKLNGAPAQSACSLYPAPLFLNAVNFCSCSCLADFCFYICFLCRVQYISLLFIGMLIVISVRGFLTNLMKVNLFILFWQKLSHHYQKYQGPLRSFTYLSKKENLKKKRKLFHVAQES